jgi:hypothetical protein
MKKCKIENFDENEREMGIKHTTHNKISKKSLLKWGENRQSSEIIIILINKNNEINIFIGLKKKKKKKSYGQKIKIIIIKKAIAPTGTHPPTHGSCHPLPLPCQRSYAAKWRKFHAFCFFLVF